MEFDTVSISSDDDIPLKEIVSLHMPVTSTDLKTRSIQHCDFCEHVFLNKYDALVHNAKHIIIPLIKRELHQCTLCLFYFTSRYKLKHHTRNKHKNDVKPNNENFDVKTDTKLDKHKLKNEKNKETNEKIVTKCKFDDDDDVPLLNGNVKGSHAIKETVKKVKCGTSVLREALLKDVKVVIEKIEIMPEKIEPRFSESVPDLGLNAEAKHKMQEIIEPVVEIAKVPQNEIKEKITNAISPPKVKISSRLRFEDDDICDDAVMKDLTTDCIVDMNLFDEPWVDEISKNFNKDDVNDVITIGDVDENATGKEAPTDVYSPSTHHEELIKPGVYRCRKCQQMFPTRFNQIQHEMIHMHIRKPRPVLCEYCDRFMGNKKALKDHISSKHLTHYRPRTYRSCDKCGLKYSSYDKHLENYHELLRCHLCNKGFDKEIDRLNHIRGHLVKIKCGQCDFVASEIEIEEHKKRFHRPFVSSAEFNLCDVCCLFLKNKHNMSYVFGETVSELGTRLDCEHCGNKFFHLTRVRRTVKGRPTDRFQFERERDRKKVLTNTERLKNIQQRLKMINKLSRF